MLVAVADTHTLIWYLYGSSRLSNIAKETIEQALANNAQIALSTISLAEIVYLVEKKTYSYRCSTTINSRTKQP